MAYITAAAASSLCCYSPLDGSIARRPRCGNEARRPHWLIRAIRRASATLLAALKHRESQPFDPTGTARSPRAFSSTALWHDARAYFRRAPSCKTVAIDGPRAPKIAERLGGSEQTGSDGEMDGASFVSQMASLFADQELIKSQFAPRIQSERPEARSSSRLRGAIRKRKIVENDRMRSKEASDRAAPLRPGFTRSA